MLPEDRPTTAERYGNALDSHHLELHPERRGDVDILIAAGWCSETLGTMLYRLRTEFDAVRSLQQQASMALGEGMKQTRQLALAATKAAADERDELAALAEDTRERVNKAALTARLFVLMGLKSLTSTKQALGHFAEAHAIRTRFQGPPPAVRLIAGRALDLWLDHRCPHCEGRGFNGGFGVPKVLCAECGATGRRQMRLGDNDARHEFGRSLLVEMDRKTEAVERLMRKFLMQHGPAASAANSEAARELHQQLHNLRSAAAQED